MSIAQEILSGLLFAGILVCCMYMVLVDIPRKYRAGSKRIEEKTQSDEKAVHNAYNTIICDKLLKIPESQWNYIASGVDQAVKLWIKKINRVHDCATESLIKETATRFALWMLVFALTAHFRSYLLGK
ncbi:MAG: hypothetical protein WC471_02950 [Candidatus Woesearchaeota archaeon]